MTGYKCGAHLRVIAADLAVAGGAHLDLVRQTLKLAEDVERRFGLHEISPAVGPGRGSAPGSRAAIAAANRSRHRCTVG